MKRFIKVQHLEEYIKKIIKESLWCEGDLIFVDIEKVNGSASTYLEKKYLK